MASSSLFVGGRNSSGYSELRTQCVQTLGTSRRTSKSENTASSGSIALESFVQNDDVTERDGGFSTVYRQVNDVGNDFINVSYNEIEEAELVEFQYLLKKESSWKRSCLHKGLISNIVFFILFAIGVVLVEVYFSQEGPRGFNSNNNTECRDDKPKCFVFRTLRSIGLFGFTAGIINWIFIELLFRKVWFLFGSGVIIKHYQHILNGFRTLIIDTIFDVKQLQKFFSGQDKKMQKMLRLESRVAGLLYSDASRVIIDEKVDKILDSPQGFTLVHMGIDKQMVKEHLQQKIQAFLTDITPTIYKRLVVPGISDGEGLKSEISYILEPKLDQLLPDDVNKIIVLMLRKHLSWLIIWGNILGGCVGLLNELVIIIVIIFAN